MLYKCFVFARTAAEFSHLQRKRIHCNPLGCSVILTAGEPAGPRASCFPAQSLRQDPGCSRRDAGRTGICSAPAEPVMIDTASLEMQLHRHGLVLFPWLRIDSPRCHFTAAGRPIAMVLPGRRGVLCCSLTSRFHQHYQGVYTFLCIYKRTRSEIRNGKSFKNKTCNRVANPKLGYK